MDIIHRIQQARHSSKVRRFHTCVVSKEEAVGEHSANVANLVLILTDGAASKGLIVAALTHDMGEAMTGDIPSPVKRQLGVEASEAISQIENRAVIRIHPYLYDYTLTDEEHTILKVADNLDGLLKCLDELYMGNRLIIPVGLNYCEYLMNALHASPCIQYFVTLFKEEVKRYV